MHVLITSRVAGDELGELDNSGVTGDMEGKTVGLKEITGDLVGGGCTVGRVVGSILLGQGVYRE